MMRLSISQDHEGAPIYWIRVQYIGSGLQYIGAPNEEE